MAAADVFVKSPTCLNREVSNNNPISVILTLRDCAPAPTVRVEQREVWHGSAGRRACSFRISFSRLGREVTRGEAALWQARVREAVQHWQKEEGGAFELR